LFSCPLIHCLMPTFREHCSSLHQGEKQPDTICLLFSGKGEGWGYEGKRERVFQGFLDVTLAGLSPTSPELFPRLVIRPLASMKEGYTGDESMWIHHDDDYGRRQGGTAPEFATERVASASGANRSNKLSSLKWCSGFAII